MNPPPFDDLGATAEETGATPIAPRPFVPSGFASIDRILQAPPHPVEARYLRGEATLVELLEVPGHDEDSGVTVEEYLAWLEGKGPACDRAG